MSFIYGVKLTGPATLPCIATVLGQLNTTLTLTPTGRPATSFPNPSVWTCRLPSAVYPTVNSSGPVVVKFGSVSENGAIHYVDYPATLAISTAGVVTVTSAHVALAGDWVGWDAISLNYTLAVAP